ncbi:MAG TPA: 50S ribosomal protein L35 [Gammaproteobacteria bacterium]|nr:50S ribosomal protein L35 [Gammaproteobacteria bacterium]
MPKLKTNRGAAKRFSRTGGGGYKRAHAYKNHILTKKAAKRKRRLRSATQVDSADVRLVRQMLPYR